MEYSKAAIARLSDEDLKTEWGKYLAYSYGRQRLRGLVQSILRKKSPPRPIRADEIAEGDFTTTKVGEREVFVARVEGKLYAIDNACGHLHYPLDQGRLEGHVVTCIWHYARFDVRTGAVISSGLDVEKLKPLEVSVASDGTLGIGEEP
jgi:3-phenylpropionate/trans-cinnamate dioxygenase ferredoxin subunit